MPKNNCIQCESNGKYKIRGKNDSECIYTEYEDCTNAKAGYDQNATSVADLLFSQGVSDDYDDDQEMGDYGGDTYEESIGFGNDVPEGDDYNCGDNEIYSHVLKKCVVDRDLTLELCTQGGTNVNQSDTSFTTFDVYSIQQQKCVTCQMGQEWDDELSQCTWINNTEDDLPDFFPCDNMDCGVGGRCEEGQCICDDGYENEDKDDRSTPCVKVSGSGGIDPDTVNTFDLEDGYKINNNIEYSIAALMLSFNPEHNDNWKGHINKDLPVWISGQVQSGEKLPETFGGDTDHSGNPLRSYKGKVPPKKHINPILHEIMCSGKTTPNKKMQEEFGTWVGLPGRKEDVYRSRGNYHYGEGGRRWWANNFPAHGEKKGESYIGDRWGYCQVHNLGGSSTSCKLCWFFCAGGLVYAADLFRMKYYEHLLTNKIPGGNLQFRGDVGAWKCVNQNNPKHASYLLNAENDKFVYMPSSKAIWRYDKDKLHKGKHVERYKYRELLDDGSKGGVTNKTRLKRIASWKGGVFSYYNHIGFIMHIKNPSIPAKAEIWCFEMNTSSAGSSSTENGAVLTFKRRRLTGYTSSKNRWNFASLDHVFGGSWAPKGLGDMEYLKDFFGVAGNPDFDKNGELSADTIKGYFTG
tara:strand:+ start:121 stop:2022 length:1902 start_codon:yes stop_codon:yes gene_type:complete